MFRRALAGVVLIGGVVFVLGGPWATGAGWVAFAYLVWRAAPGVARDVRGVRGRVPAGLSVPRFGKARGERL
jgi:hypothetical protein